MGKIRLLPLDIINKIAAGEVIERPASVAKELVENSLDSGADDVKIDIEEGGKKLIRIKDNGEGMDEDDLKLAFTPHATSKIKEVEDVFTHSTFGFRGEALASIASVSQVTLVSSTKNSNSGYKIKITPGEPPVITPTQSVNGTIVEVRNLFLNIPARRKFLKSDRVEWEQIHEYIKRFVISRPGIRFELKSDDKPQMLALKSNITQRLAEIFGQETSESFLKIEREAGPFALEAFCARPRFSRVSTDQQYIFVNGKYVRDRMLSRALNESYRHVLVSGRFPIAVLFVRVPDTLVDYNVHPTKIEVRFKNGWEIYNFVFNSLHESLLKSELTQSIQLPETMTIKYEPIKSARKQMWTPPQTFEKTIPQIARELPRPFQVHNKFIITEVEDGILIIDQHALHERVLLEKLKRQFSSEGTSKQLLLIPSVVNVTREEKRILEENRKLLTGLGIDFEEFSPDSIIVRSLPAILRNVTADTLIHDFVAIAHNKLVQIEKALELVACKAAVKFGDKLSDNEISTLLDAREILENRHSCAHGRPVAVKIEVSKLESYFMR